MITICEYDANWPVLFEEEAHRLHIAFGSTAQRIEHVGSTSVPALAARLATRRQQGRNVQEVIRLLNPVLRGFGNYYRRANVKGLFEQVDAWIRMRVRCFMEKKRAVKHQNRRIPTALLERMGLLSLTVLYTKSLLPPVMGQLYRKAVYGKSVCTV